MKPWLSADCATWTEPSTSAAIAAALSAATASQANMRARGDIEVRTSTPIAANAGIVGSR